MSPGPRTPSGPLHHLGWAWLALLAAALLVVSAPSRRAAAAPPGGWEYRLLAWSEEDTAAVLRQVSGANELTDPLELARALERQGPLLDDPRLQAAVDARLEEKLQAAGQEGWEAFWVRERTSLAGGAPLRTASLLLRRPRA